MSGYKHRQCCSDCGTLYDGADLVATVHVPPNGVVCDPCRDRRMELFGDAWKMHQPSSDGGRR